MFSEITLRNYRTHRNTTIALHPITLLIGDNNSGKSNILQGIRHLSYLVWRSDPRRSNSSIGTIRAGTDYFRHRYRLARDDEPMAWAVSWDGDDAEIEYELELLQTKTSGCFVRCREQLRVKDGKGDSIEAESGFIEDSNRLALRTQVERRADLPEEVQRACREFFGKLGGAFEYHFQPSFLNNSRESDSTISPYEQNERIRIPSEIGYEGGNFQRLIFYVRDREERVFSRFVAQLRRFNGGFHGVRLNDRDFPIWEFDLGSKRTDRPVEEFTPDLLSDGFLKAAAIALIVCLDRPPSIIMLEEIENGINPGNIREILQWLWHAALAERTTGTPQFILTSHSPSVLREFSKHLENVYNFRLVKETHESDVRNLSTSLDTLVGLGLIDGSVTEDEEGNKNVEIPPYQLTDLWYSGTIG